MRAGNPGVPTASEWLNEVLAPGGRVGIDPVSFLWGIYIFFLCCMLI